MLLNLAEMSPAGVVAERSISTAIMNLTRSTSLVCAIPVALDRPEADRGGEFTSWNPRLKD